MAKEVDLLVRGFAGYASLGLCAFVLTFILRHLSQVYRKQWLRLWTRGAATLTVYFGLTLLQFALSQHLPASHWVRLLHVYAIQLCVYAACTFFVAGGLRVITGRSLNRRAVTIGTTTLFVLPALTTLLIPLSTTPTNAAFFLAVILPHVSIGGTALAGFTMGWQARRASGVGMRVATTALLVLGVIQLYLVYILYFRGVGLQFDQPVMQFIQFAEIIAFILSGLGLVLWTLEERRHRLKQTMSRLQKVQVKVGEVERIKSALLRNLQHEIRTPLTGILGYAELLREKDPPVEMVAEAVETNGTRLLKLLTDLLDLALYEAHVNEVHASDRVRIDALVEEIAESWRSRAEDKGLVLTVDVEDGKEIVRVDASGFQRILDQLLSNAIKFTVDGGVTVAVASSHEEIVVSVQDTGPGIPAEFHPRLFEAFSQASDGLDREFEGIGLGLTLAHKISNLIGVDLRVDSAPDRGTCFSVTIPRLPENFVRTQYVRAVTTQPLKIR